MDRSARRFTGKREKRWLIALALHFTFLAPWTDLQASQPLLESDSTLVLLSGLPGDVESENSYRDQLQAWVELAQNGGGSRTLFVLCDHPESVSVPAGVNAKILRGNRTNFLELSKVLPRETKGLVVVAWGHGGRQGTEPVFHVRGPRLTPDDFKRLAEAVPAVESRWILIFRGSGAFASQLAMGKRQVLSSDADRTFNSDPVGMGLLLKLLRDKPALSLEELSESFGRATGAWYTQRNLARTEEPTLWGVDEKPRPLIQNEQVATERSAKKEPVERAREDKTRRSPEVPEDLSPSWKGIKKVEARDYSTAEGVVLRRRLSYTLGSAPAVASEREEFIQILSAEGKSLGDFDISYSPPFEDVNFLDCEVLRPDGKLTRLDPDAIREAREESVGDYQFGRRKFFSLPGVVSGAVLHVRYRTQWMSFPLPHISLEIPLEQELPVLDGTLQVSVAKDAAFHFAIERMAVGDPEVKQGNYAATYTWHFENVPAREADVLVSPHLQARLVLSTFPNWPAFSGWYERISQLADEVTPEIAAKAEELTRGVKSERDKVAAVYNYVTGLRYVAVPMGVNSFRPHAAANVLRNQFGDCKDKANLFNTLLHSLKLEAHLVLVPRFKQAYDGIPGLAFNHAISRVRLQDETLWVDTTDDVCRFGMLPPGDAGRNVLVMDGQSATLTHLPAPELSEHRLKLRAEVDCSATADALPVTLTAVGAGYSDYELREGARQKKEHAASLPLLATHFRLAAGAFALEKQSATAVAALDEDFTWRGEGNYIGIVSSKGQGETLRAPFWLPKEWDAALHRRREALFLNQGYPLALEQEIEFKGIAKRLAEADLPKPGENHKEPLQWRVEWQKVGEDKVVVKLRAGLTRGDLSADDTPLFQSQLRSLLASLGRDVTVSPSP